jgi:hypothetical protein
MFDEWAATVNADAGLVHRGRYVNAVVLLDLGDESHLISIRDGRVESITPKPRVMPLWTFAIRAPREEWTAFWQPRPLPGHHDIMALLRRQVMVVEGDLHPLMANLRYFKDVLQIPRGQADAA